MKCGQDQQPTCENGMKATMVMMKNNQAGDDNTLTSGMGLVVVWDKTLTC